MKFKYFGYPDLSFGYKLNNIYKEIDIILTTDADIKMNLERFEVLKYFNDKNIGRYIEKDLLNNLKTYRSSIKKNIGVFLIVIMILKRSLIYYLEIRQSTLQPTYKLFRNIILMSELLTLKIN